MTADPETTNSWFTPARTSSTSGMLPLEHSENTAAPSARQDVPGSVGEGNDQSARFAPSQSMPSQPGPQSTGGSGSATKHDGNMQTGRIPGLPASLFQPTNGHPVEGYGSTSDGSGGNRHRPPQSGPPPAPVPTREPVWPGQSDRSSAEEGFPDAAASQGHAADGGAAVFARNGSSSTGEDVDVPGANGARTPGTPVNGAQVNGSPVNGSPVNGGGVNGGRVNGAPRAPGVPANGAPANGAPANGDGVNGSPVNGAQVNGGGVNGGRVNGAPVAPANGAPANGAQVNGSPVNGGGVNGGGVNGGGVNGSPVNGTPPNGAPGVPANGAPTHGVYPSTGTTNGQPDPWSAHGRSVPANGQTPSGSSLAARLGSPDSGPAPAEEGTARMPLPMQPGPQTPPRASAPAAPAQPADTEAATSFVEPVIARPIGAESDSGVASPDAFDRFAHGHDEVERPPRTDDQDEKFEPPRQARKRPLYRRIIRAILGPDLLRKDPPRKK